ncbi:cobalt-precorrin-6A reductase [Aestuariivirga sp.]|uniref:cobalt-precorrin-6A reductase n=1 Tax=Aestuariivirga sp. TaxID=2650926 RepID=UPI00391A13F2
MSASRILILGGTREARDLAARLIAEGFDVTSSLAGVTTAPRLPEGSVRRGGFGGVEGLLTYLSGEGIALVIDATHPFATQISAHAHEACRRLGLPLLRLERPAWEPAGDAPWRSVRSAEEAVTVLPAGARALVTIGRKDIAPFLARSDISGVVRMIEMPREEAIPSGWTLLLERPPFSREAEMALMRGHAISHLVSKNSGGGEMAPKIEAAAALGIPVIMIARPGKPQAATLVSAEAVAGAVRRLLLP